MTNFTLIQNEVICDIRLSDGSYRLYNLLLSLAYNNKISVYPSQKYMAVALGKSVRSVQRYLKELIKLGFISIRRRGSTSNLITLLKKQTQQAVKQTQDKVKKAYNAFKTQNKDNTKVSSWSTKNNRNYKWNKLESALLGKNEFDYEELLE